MSRSNITVADFSGGGRKVTAAALYQYDYGQVLQFDGIEDLPAAYEVHFSNDRDAGYTKTQIGDENGVIIPDEYLLTGRPIYAWLFLHAGASDGETEYQVVVPINRRSKPIDKAPTPVQQSAIDQAIAALNAGVKATEASQTAAETAQGKAEDAQSAAEAAQTAAETAQSKAEDAQAAAETAQGKAEDAQSAAEAAQTAAETAQGKAEDAQSAAEAAQTAAETAQGKAEDAQAAAETAQGKAEDAQSAAEAAQTAAETAQGKAEDAQSAAEAAQTAAETAQGKAEDAQAAAEAAVIDKADIIISSASGTIASFADGAALPVVDLTVDIDPIQDLHGYANPWPGGGGKNKFGVTDVTDLPNGTNKKLSISDGLMTVTATGSVASTAIAGTSALANAIINATLSAGTYYFKIFDFSSTVTGATADNIKLRIETNGTNTDYTRNTAFTLSADSTIVGFFVAAALQWNSGNTMKFRVAISATNVDAWTPYSNICPISGRTGLSVYRTGINLWDEEWELGTLNWSTDANATSTTRIRSKNYIPCVGDTVYYVRIPTSAVYIFYYDADNNFISYLSSSKANTTFTTPSNARYIRFFTASDAYGTTYNNDISINYPATDTDYHAHDGSTYAVEWTSQAGTVYGGTLDVVTGVLTVDKTFMSFDGTENWGLVNAADFMTVLGPMNSIINDSAICSHYLDNPNISTGNYQTGIRCYNRSATPYSGAALLVRPDAPLSMSLADFKTWLATENTNGTPLQVCYELATPIEYTLTTQEVVTLLGSNNIWSDSGDVSVQYRADTKLYIDNKIAQAIAQALNA